MLELRVGDPGRWGDQLRQFGRGVWGQLARGLEVRLLLYWFSLTFAGRPDATGS